MKNKIDFRKKSQYINIDKIKVYIWLYKKENYIGYGVQGTSFHKVLENYKNYNNNEILRYIKKDLKENFKEC